MNNHTTTSRQRITLDWNQLLGFNQVQATEKAEAHPARAMVGSKLPPAPEPARQVPASRAMVGGKVPAAPKLNRHAVLAAKVGAKAGIKAG